MSASTGDVKVNVKPEATEQDFKLVCKNIGKKMLRLGEELGLTKGEIEHIELDYEKYGAYEQTRQMLDRWKQTRWKDATWVKLAEKLANIEMIMLANQILEAHGSDERYNEEDNVTVKCLTEVSCTPEAGSRINKIRPEGTSKILSSQINPKQIDVISHSISIDWERLATYLDFTPSDKNLFRADNHFKGEAHMCEAMLWKFVERKASEATVGHVVDALREIERNDIVEKLLKQNPQ